MVNLLLQTEQKQKQLKIYDKNIENIFKKQTLIKKSKNTRILEFYLESEINFLLNRSKKQKFLIKISDFQRNN